MSNPSFAALRASVPDSVVLRFIRDDAATWCDDVFPGDGVPGWLVVLTPAEHSALRQELRRIEAPSRFEEIDPESRHRLALARPLVAGAAFVGIVDLGVPVLVYMRLVARDEERKSG